MILSHSSEIGGGELSMLDFFDFWTKQNKNLELLFIIKYPVDRLGKELERRGWKYQVLDYSQWSAAKISKNPEDLFRNSRRNSKTILEIDKIIQDYKPSAVATNTMVSPWAAFAAKLNGLPHIWFVREYGDIDHGHTLEIGRQATFEDIGLLSELVVTNSLALKKHVEQYGHPEKVVPLYTPFNVEKINKRSNQKIKSPFTKNAQLKAVMAGVIRPSKGQEQAIRAVAQLKKRRVNVELCLIGPANNPDYEQELKNLAKDRGVDGQIHFVGRQVNPYPYMKHADVGIMASKMEAFGRVTFEYLALGKPVIGAASGGTLEMVQDGKNGFLYETGKVEDMTEKLEFYTKNPELLKEHQKTAKNSALHMISGKYGAAALIKRINNLIASDDEFYRLPNFTRQWLGIPKLAEKIQPKKDITHKLKVAKRLGPKKTYHEVRRRLGSRINQHKR